MARLPSLQKKKGLNTVNNFYAYDRQPFSIKFIIPYSFWLKAVMWHICQGNQSEIDPQGL